MKKALLFVVVCFLVFAGSAQSPIGRWKKISSVVEYEGKKMDMHEALLTQRPCAAKIIYLVNEDGTYRLDASNSGCDESYKSIQQKLWSKTKWRVVGDKITISATNFELGQTYSIKYNGNQMIWTGTEGQGVTVYQRL